MTVSTAAADRQVRQAGAFRAQAVLQAIADDTLRMSVQNMVSHALAALTALGQMHLPQDNFEAHTTGNVDPNWHLALAPPALAVLSAINHLLAYIMENCDAPTELGASLCPGDPQALEFDMVPAAQTDCTVSTAPPRRPNAFDSPLSQTAQVAEVCHLLGAMLRDRVLAFAESLRTTAHAQDTWLLLAELDDNKRRLSKAVQGLMYGVYGIFSPELPREDIWPNYRSAVDEAVALRSALTDLAIDMRTFRGTLSQVEPAARSRYILTMAEYLAYFTTLSAYRGLRANDKKAIIDFRRTLLGFCQPTSPEWEHAQRALSHALADFETFLGAMYVINHREVLILHDRLGLEAAAAKLEQLAEEVRLAPDTSSLPRAQAHLDRGVQQLRPLHGRSSELDAAAAAYPAQPAADAAKLLQRVTCLQNTVRPLLNTMI